MNLAKKIKLSIVIVTILSSNVSASFKDAFSNASYDGYLRAGYQKQINSEVSLGGKLHFETASINSVSFGSSFYTTQGIGKKYNNSGVSFFSSNKTSYSILGEAYLRAKIKNTLLKIGRQKFNSPYANTDDIGMIPNTFEALTFENQNFENITIVLSQLQKFSGVDASRPEKFNIINHNNGMKVVGIKYNNKKDLLFEGWYYHALNMVRLSYLEIDYKKELNLFNLTVGGQYTNQDYENSNKATIFGVSFETSFSKIGLNFSASFNKVNSKNGQVAENFFGGGPFYINCEHITLAEVGTDARAYRYSTEINGNRYGADNLTLIFSYLVAKGKDKKSLNEIDIITNYILDADLSFKLIYSDIRDKLSHTNSFKNMRFFINYNF